MTSDEELRWLDNGVDLLYGNGFESNSLHVLTELSRNFFQNLFCEITHSHRLIKSHKLDYVSRTRPLRVISKQRTIAIKLVHTAEVCVTYTDNND